MNSTLTFVSLLLQPWLLFRFYAVTNEESTQVANRSANPPVMNPSYEDRGKKRLLRFEFTQGAAAGDATSTAKLVWIPAGKGLLLLKETWLYWSAYGASRVLDVGYTAHTDSDGDAVVADPNAFDDDIDISSAGSAALGSDYAATNAGVWEYDSKDGFYLLGTVAGGTIPAAAVLTGYVTIVQD